MRLNRLVFAGVLLLVVGSAVAAVRRHAVAPASRGMAEVHRIVMVVLENTDEVNAIAQPFLSELASRGALLRNYHALTHPSLPNYIAMVAGSTYGVVDDKALVLDAPHLGDLFDARGLRWKVYAEGYPGDCFTGLQSGRYVRRHVPFLNFASLQNDRARCNAAIVNATEFDADIAADALPAFAMYIPDLDNDGHDTGVAFADAWLRRRFGPLLDDPQFMKGTLLIVMFDEGTTSGPNVVYCAFYGAGIAAPTVNRDFYDHYSLLRTIEEIFHLGTLQRNDEAADIIRGIWR